MRSGARNEACQLHHVDMVRSTTHLQQRYNFENADLRNSETIQQLGESQLRKLKQRKNANENAAAYKANKAQSWCRANNRWKRKSETKLESVLLLTSLANRLTWYGVYWLVIYLRWRESVMSWHTLTALSTQEQWTLEEARQRGEVLDPVAEQQLASDPEFIKNGYVEYQQVLSWSGARKRNQDFTPA